MKNDPKHKEIYGAGGGGGGKKKSGGGGQQVVHHTTTQVVHQAAPTPYTPSRLDDDEFLRSVSFAKLQYLMCEGEIEGPALGDSNDSDKVKLEKSVFVDGTPLRLSNNTIQFEPEDLALTLGTPNQSACPDYDYVETPKTVGRVVQKDLPVSQFIDVPDVGLSYRARVLLTFRNLYLGNSRGDLLRTTVVYKIQYTDDLSVTREVTPTGGESLTGKFSSQFVRQHQFDLEGQPPWNITVTRVTDDDSSRSNGSTQYGSTFEFENVILSLKQKLRYPCSSILTLGIKADTYAAIPNVSVQLKGCKVQIPSNYDPVTRTYTGTWDGTFASQPAYTNNPAWVFYAVVTNERWGLGTYIDPALVDKWTLYDIGRYCDQQVQKNNANTDTEPRFTCNLLLQTAEDAWVVLQQLSSVFRGMIYYSGGTIVPVQNRNETGDGTTIKPIFTFNEANTLQETSENGVVQKGNFTYSGSSRRARHTVVLVSYDDAENTFNNRVEYIADEDGLQRFGYRALDLRLLGVTSRGQALRAANWALLTEKLLDDTVTFKTNELGSVVRPGDLIEVADPSKTENQARRGGRIISISGNTVVLDSAQALPSGASNWNGAKLYFMVRGEELPRMEYGTVSTLSSATVSISAWESTERPQAGDPWLLELGTATGGVTYRVLAVSEDEHGVYAVSALRYRADIYNTVDNGTPLQNAEEFGLTIVRPNPPTINAATLKYTTDVVKVVATWTTPNASVERYGIDTMVEEYVLQYQAFDKTTTDRDGVWTTISGIKNNKYEFSIEDFDENSNYKMRVASITRLQTQSDWSTLYTIQNLLDSTPLPPISGQVDDPGWVDPGDGSTAPQVNATTLSYIPNPDGSHTFFWNFNIALPSYVSGVELEAKPATTALTALQEQLMGLDAPNADGYYVLGSALLDSNFNWTVPMSEFKTNTTTLIAPYVQAWTVRMRLTTYIENTKGNSYVSVTMNLDDILPPTPRDFFVTTEVQRQTESLIRSFSWQQGYGTESTTSRTGYERDLVNYQIRYISADQTFSSNEDYWTYGITLDSGVVPSPSQNFETSLVPVGNWKVMIRAFDKTGFASPGYASIALQSVGRLPANIVSRYDCRDNLFKSFVLQGYISTIYIDSFSPYLGLTTGVFYKDDFQDELYELSTKIPGAVLKLYADPINPTVGVTQINSIFYCAADATALQVAVDTSLTYKLFLRKVTPDSDIRPTEYFTGVMNRYYVAKNSNYIYARGEIAYGYTPLFGPIYQYFYPADPAYGAVRDANNVQGDYWGHFYESTLGYEENPYHQYQDGEKIDEGFYQWALLALVDDSNADNLKVIRDIDFIMDYPDVLEQFEDLYVPVEGLTVNLTKRFRKITTTSTAFQQSSTASGNAVQVVEKTNTHVKLRAVIAPGVVGDGYVDLLVAGY